jgi:tRNA(adenine34) deaminase
MNNHETYMHEALLEAKEALRAGEFPVGSVMVYKGEIISRGHRINSKAPNENELDHAEIVALRKIFEQHPEKDRSKITVYSTMEPCLMCYVTLLLNGIQKIVYGYEDTMGGGTNLDLQALNPLYSKMSVEIVPRILRMECLELFNKFVNEPGNIYWKDSPLAQYALAQTGSDTKK